MGFKRCPNCDRPTRRTADWACEWCGYSLVDSSYEKADKTFSELESERRPAFEPRPETTHWQPVRPTGSRPQPPPPPQQPPEIAPLSEISPPEPSPETRPEPPLQESPGPPPAPVEETGPAAEVLSAEEPFEAEQPDEEIVPERQPPIPEPAPAPAVPIPDLDRPSGELSVTVDGLNAAFRADSAAAHSRLAGKIIAVSGTVEKVVIKEHLEIRYIILAGGGGESQLRVRGTFGREYRPELSKLSTGQQATIKGAYQGFERNILLERCELIA